MPRKYPKHKKLDALELLSYGLPVHDVQASTGIAPRTLYRWKKQMRRKQQRLMAKKEPALMTKTSQNRDYCHKNHDSCHKSPDHCHKTADHCHKTADHCHKSMTVDAQLTQNDHGAPADYISANSNEEDLTYIRSQLMKVVRDIVSGLDHHGPDINTRSLAISRLLDRIQWLDQLIDRQDTEPVAEVETHSFPGWLRLRPDRSDEQRAAEQAEMDRRRAWAESRISDDEFWGTADSA